MGLYSLFKVIVLITNALAILHEKRFLPRIGLATGGDVVPDQFGQVQQGGLKDKIATLLQAVRILLRIPLIGANLVIITLEVLLGR